MGDGRVVQPGTQVGQHFEHVFLEFVGGSGRGNGDLDREVLAQAEFGRVHGRVQSEAFFISGFLAQSVPYLGKVFLRKGLVLFLRSGCILGENQVLLSRHQIADGKRRAGFPGVSGRSGFGGCKRGLCIRGARRADGRMDGGLGRWRGFCGRGRGLCSRGTRRVTAGRTGGRAVF